MAMAARTTAVVSFAICFIFGVGCFWRGAANGSGSCGGCVDNESSCGVALKLSNRFFGALAGARFFFGFRPRHRVLRTVLRWHQGSHASGWPRCANEIRSGIPLLAVSLGLPRLPPSTERQTLPFLGWPAIWKATKVASESGCWQKSKRVT
jgi:hypothetical protein